MQRLSLRFPSFGNEDDDFSIVLKMCTAYQPTWSKVKEKLLFMEKEAGSDRHCMLRNGKDFPRGRETGDELIRTYVC